MTTASRYPREQALKEHYESNLEYFSTEIAEIMAHLGHDSLPDVRSILDLGCGDGRACFALAAMAPNATLTGVDYSEGRIELASRKVKPGQHISFEHVDVHDYLDMCMREKRRFDLIIANEVLEHLEDPRGVIEKLKQLTPWIVGTCPLNLPYDAHLSVYTSIPEVMESFPEFTVSQMGHHALLEWRGHTEQAVPFLRRLWTTVTRVVSSRGWRS